MGKSLLTSVVNHNRKFVWISSMSITVCKPFTGQGIDIRIIKKQEAMENFVFPDEIDKTKLMKINDEHFFMFPKIMQKCSKLYAFSLIIDLKTSGKRPFL